MNETIMTDIYRNNSWGCKETVSGPSSTLAKTELLRSILRQTLNELEITSLLDCGCGDFHWMNHVDLVGIQYLGVDIVDALITKNQNEYTNDTILFQKMDILQEPPEYADLWFARDFCCLYPIADNKLFFQKFLESNSKYLALTSIDTEQANKDGISGSWRPLNMTIVPFCLHSPIVTIEDGLQWFRKKTLQIYTRQQIEVCTLLNSIESLFNFSTVDSSMDESMNQLIHQSLNLQEQQEQEQQDTTLQLRYFSNSSLRRILLRGQGLQKFKSIFQTTQASIEQKHKLNPLQSQLQSQSQQIYQQNQSTLFQNIPLRERQSFMNQMAIPHQQGPALQNIPLRQIQLHTQPQSNNHLTTNIPLRKNKK